MIALNQEIFSRAAAKARTVHPAVRQYGPVSLVSRSDGGQATVRFVARDGAIWAECSCPAGSPRARRSPLACYHVAAAVIAASKRRTDAETTYDYERERLAAEWSAAQGQCQRCGRPTADEICNQCDQDEADKLTWEQIYGGDK